MKKITLILMSLLVTLGAVAQDYTPRHTGSKSRIDRNVTSVKVIGGTYAEQKYDLDYNETRQNYTDATENAIFKVYAGEELTPVVEHAGEWVHHAVYVDYDADGFTSGIKEGSNWEPAGDLVSYSFYNNGGSSDENGYNSLGVAMSGMDRHMPGLPVFTAPTKPGIYRMRFVQTWCSIDPAGDADGKFGDFMGNGDQIVDVMLQVEGPATPLVENGKLYRIKNRCMNLGLSQQNAGDGNGAYLGSTYYTLQHYNQNIREIHCATTSKADAGCIWMFEGSDSDGWAIKNMNNGMYIDDQRGDAALKENAHLYVKFVEGIENAARFTIEEKGTYVTFCDDDFKESHGNYLHAFAAGLQVWSANDSDAASHWTIEPATKLEVNLNEYTNNDDREGKNNGYYASLYLPFDVTFDPSVISVNTVTVQGTSAILDSQDDITTLPANSGVIVKGNGGTYTFGIPGTVSKSLSDNELGGTNVDLTLDGSNSTKYFVLGKDANGVLGLRTPSSSVAKIPANRAYLSAPTGGSVNALRFDLGETTAIENVVTEKGNALIYDLTGRRVLNTVKGGIYIQNGKKFIVK